MVAALGSFYRKKHAVSKRTKIKSPVRTDRRAACHAGVRQLVETLIFIKDDSMQHAWQDIRPAPNIPSMMKLHWSQQTIVLLIFFVLFAGFSLFLEGFFQLQNLLTLLQNVAILGILGLGMALVVIGRGIDISLIAALAVPAGLVLQMVQNGHEVLTACAAGAAVALLFGLINGWLIAYAEVPSLFTTLASGLFLAGLGQVAFFQLDVVQWPERLNAIGWLGRGAVLGLPKPIVMFALVALAMTFFLRKLRLGLFVYALGDNPFAARASGLPTRFIVALVPAEKS